MSRDRGAANDPAERLARRLGLEPHPEGGAFREVFRASRVVRLAGENRDRPAFTTIHFLLRAGEHSRWHRVAHDEVWHFYEGDPLDLWVADPDLGGVERHRLSAASGTGTPVVVVPAGGWQAARTTGRYSLMGCTVAPGFEYGDWSLLAERADLVATLASRHPDLAGLI
jgi:predicted cupin superfamily sugar epimerase